MSYAKSVLQEGETIVATGRLHWIIYWPAIVFLVAGTMLVWLEYRHWPDSDLLIASTAITFGVLFVVAFVRAWFVRWITEFAATSRRVISKRGFIWRETEEMNMDKVETVDIDQTVLGRLLDYGTIKVMGTGGSNAIEVRRIAEPFEMRNAIIAK
jgi:membrane protein YdbS with pleckstrin-like domain